MSKPSRIKRTGRAIWSFFDGPSSIAGFKTRKTVGLAKDEVKNARGLVSERVDFWKSEIEQTKPRVESRTETFDEAMARHGLSDSDIQNLHKSLLIKNRIEFFAMYLAFIGALTAAFFGGLLGVISGFSFTIVFAVMKSRTSFRLFQVEKRTLITFRAFFANHGATRIFGYV